jgi:hypothetical protein
MDDSLPVLMTLEREVIDSGRSISISATTLPDGSTSLSVRSGPVDDPNLNELTGVIAREDLQILARVLKPELAAIAAWQGLPADERATTMAERRRNHPNAYAPWTDEQELHLLELHEAGKPVREIARQLGRQPGGVIRRLEKLAAG